MDTPTPAAGSSPAPTPPPAAPAATSAPAAPVAPASPSPVSSAPVPTGRDILGALSPAERRSVVLGQKKLADVLVAKGATPAPAAAPATPATAAASEPAAEPASPAADPGTSTAEPEGGQPDGGERAPERFRFKDSVDQAVALLAKTKGIGLIEAAQLYQGKESSAPAPAVPTPPAAPSEPAVDTGLAEYDTQISSLSDRIKKLAEDRTKARDDVDNEKADKISDDIAEAKAELRLLEHEKKGYVRTREQAAVQTAQQQVSSSRDRALAQYPELQTEGSMPRLALDAYVHRALHDPARAGEFKDHSWPERITAEFAQKHGLKKAGSAASTPAPVATPAPAPVPATTPTPSPAALLRNAPRQVPGAKLVSSADGSHPSPAMPTVEDFKAALPQMPAAKRRELAVHAMNMARRGAPAR